MKRLFLPLVGLALIFFLFGLPGLAQAGNQFDTSSPKATLIHTLSKSNSEEKSAWFDMLFNEMGKVSGSKGYIIIYCGRTCAYGEIEAHIRGMRQMKIAPRKFPSGQIVIVNGGFRDVLTTELWVMPIGACPPPPSPTVEIESVRFKGMKKGMVAYDCCDLAG